jgi:hypothetical protein
MSTVKSTNTTLLTDQFIADSNSCGCIVDLEMSRRIVSSLHSKQFLILTGLSGSGKTQAALLLSSWLTGGQRMLDPFRQGTSIHGSTTTYLVRDADRLSVELWNADDEHTATRILLPRQVIEEWAKYIGENGIPQSTPSLDIRNHVQSESMFSNQLHSFHAPLKAAAFALLNADTSPAVQTRGSIIPVGADWTGSDSVLGYPDGLDGSRYVSRPALELILDAIDDPRQPYFLILDEMNMSHVERYFADFLSAIESGEAIPLYEGGPRKAGEREVPRWLTLPPNLFVIGTVNVDETTYMFSPKVLDRANVIEFRMNESEMSAFLGKPIKPDLDALKGRGAEYAESFVLASRRIVQVPASVHPQFQSEMETFFKALQNHHAEFGYRTAHEVGRFISFYHELTGSPDHDQWFAAAMDAAVVQKLLPKLHGSRVKLAKLLRALWMLTRYAPGQRPNEAKDPNEAELSQAHYPLSADKIVRMWRLLAENGFASFAEA